jgi:ubiquinone/menaquinone biosynthesis C-methylase UbiE
MLDIARKAIRDAGLSTAVQLVLADAKKTPLPSKAFDVVFSNSLLHHLPDLAPIWREVKRLAKPGAVVLFRDLARPADTETARRIVHRYAGQASALLQEEYYRSLLAAYTPQEICARLEQAGLQCLEVKMVTDRHLDVFGRL